MTITPQSPEWLAQRQLGIGGSDIAALLGLSRYRTPLYVWEDKTGRTPPLAMSEPMEWGHRLEPVVLDRFSEDHGPVERHPLLPAIHIHQSVPIARASLDGMLRLPNGDGEPVDAKTTRRGWDDVPDEYVMQVQWQMGVTGTTHGWVAALLGGSEYREYPIPFDRAVFEDALEYAQRFWRDHVLADKPPAPSSRDDLNRAFQPEKGKQAEVPESLWEAYMAAREQEDAAKKWRSMLEQDLKLMVGDATEVTSGGVSVATWRERRGSLRVDITKLKQEWPGIYAAVAKETEGTRTWRVK